MEMWYLRDSVNFFSFLSWGALLESFLGIVVKLLLVPHEVYIIHRVVSFRMYVLYVHENDVSLGCTTISLPSCVCG